MKTLSIFFALIVSAVFARYPILMWSNKDLGKDWKAGTEIFEQIGEDKFAETLKEILTEHAVFICFPIVGH